MPEQPNLSSDSDDKLETFADISDDDYIKLEDFLMQSEKILSTTLVLETKQRESELADHLQDYLSAMRVIVFGNSPDVTRDEAVENYYRAALDIHTLLFDKSPMRGDTPPIQAEPNQPEQAE